VVSRPAHTQVGQLPTVIPQHGVFHSRPSGRDPILFGLSSPPHPIAIPFRLSGS
jgi:hypothetical protein